MAAPVHNPSRRALLGAAASLSFGAAVGVESPLHHPSGGPPPRPGEERLAWRDALAAYRSAEAVLREYEGVCRGRSFEEQEGLEAGYEVRAEALYGALRGLLGVPAPDVKALAVKIGLVVEHEVGTLDGGEACMVALREDAVRLAAA